MDMPVGSVTIPLATAVIDLDPDEYFMTITGTRLSYAPSPPLIGGVASLTFITNKQVFGPFGTTSGSPFEIQGPIYAFHGAVSRGPATDILTAIGFWRLPPGKLHVTLGLVMGDPSQLEWHGCPSHVLGCSLMRHIVFCCHLQSRAGSLSTEKPCLTYTRRPICIPFHNRILARSSNGSRTLPDAAPWVPPLR
jgi:hypothetical protein